MREELDSLFGFLVKVKNEPQDITGIDQSDNDGIPRMRNVITKDRFLDTGLNKFDYCVLVASSEQLGLPSSMR